MRKLVVLVCLLAGCASPGPPQPSEFMPGRFTLQGFVCDGECQRAYRSAVRGTKELERDQSGS